MFTDFTATDRWTKKPMHCLYQALIVAIATRHADAVDIKFLVDGRPVWVALPHPAWVEYKRLWNPAKVWAAKCTPSPSTKLSNTSKGSWPSSNPLSQSPNTFEASQKP